MSFENLITTGSKNVTEKKSANLNTTKFFSHFVNRTSLYYKEP